MEPTQVSRAFSKGLAKTRSAGEPVKKQRNFTYTFTYLEIEQKNKLYQVASCPP